MFEFKAQNVQQLLSDLQAAAADKEAEIPKERFHYLMQYAYLFVALHQTEGFTLEGFLDSPDIGRSIVRRYCLGSSIPSGRIRPYVFQAISKYCADAWAAHSERSQRSAAAFRAFNMAIQRPEFNGTAFFDAANNPGGGGIVEAMSRAVEGDFNTPPGDKKPE